MKKWYGLVTNGELTNVKQFDSDQLPSLEKVEDFRLWDVPFLLTAEYYIVELDITMRKNVSHCDAALKV